MSRGVALPRPEETRHVTCEASANDRFLQPPSTAKGPLHKCSSFLTSPLHFIEDQATLKESLQSAALKNTVIFHWSSQLSPDSVSKRSVRLVQTCLDLRAQVSRSPPDRLCMSKGYKKCFIEL